MPSEREYHSLAVVDVVDETPDARSFVLEIPSALAPTFRYSAGQSCAFRAAIDGEHVVRCYSMSSSPETGDPFTVTVKRVPGGRMSNWMNDHLAAGDRIDALPPAGRFVLRDAESPIVGFAGGSGITPLLSIVKSALARTRREIALVYANRSADGILFAAELERLRAASGGRLSLHHHLDTAGGFLDAAACAEQVGERAHADFYVCGPAPYMEVVEAGLALRGVAPEQVFVERFELPDGAAPAEEASVTESVVFRIGRRKHSVAYRPGDTLLATARRAGLSPRFACEAGSCATCIGFLEAGTATMRVNNALEPGEVEEGWILTCQAIPTSREVVVDYDR